MVIEGGRTRPGDPAYREGGCVVRQAVRFVEVVVNRAEVGGPWPPSYIPPSPPRTRQRRIGRPQILARLADHATTRVGPRGGQVQVPVQQLDAATMRHYTSPAGVRTGTCTYRSTPGYGRKTGGRGGTRSGCGLPGHDSTLSWDQCLHQSRNGSVKSRHGPRDSPTWKLVPADCRLRAAFGL